jgi:hypothetical protein
MRARAGRDAVNLDSPVGARGARRKLELTDELDCVVAVGHHLPGGVYLGLPPFTISARGAAPFSIGDATARPGRYWGWLFSPVACEGDERGATRSRVKRLTLGWGAPGEFRRRGDGGMKRDAKVLVGSSSSARRAVSIPPNHPRRAPARVDSLS